MMQFSVKTTRYQKNSMLNICDAQLLGREITESDLKIHITEMYYGERFVHKEDAIELLQGASIINMVGRDTISLALDLKIGNEKGVREIDGVPFLIVFKM